MIRELVSDYKKISGGVDRLIKLSGYRIGYVQKEMGINNASFYYKRKQAKFRIEEIERILDIIDIDKLEDKVLLEMGLEAEKGSETITLAEAINESRSKKNC